MRSFPDPFTAAVVQWSPSVNDAALGTQRACLAIEEAARKHGAKLVVFPEAWLTGYPYFEGLGPGAEFRAIYRRAWERGLKGCTVFRPNRVTGAVLTGPEPRCERCEVAPAP